MDQLRQLNRDAVNGCDRLYAGDVVISWKLKPEHILKRLNLDKTEDLFTLLD
jgi:hypothetical protein